MEAWLKANNLPSGVIDVKGTGSSPPRRVSIRAGLGIAGWTRTPRSLPCHCLVPDSRTPHIRRPRAPHASGQARSLMHPKDLSDLDRATHERMADVDAKALLGKDTLLLLANGDPEKTPTARMSCGESSSGPHRYGSIPMPSTSACSTVHSKRDYGSMVREWFDRQFFCPPVPRREDPGRRGDPGRHRRVRVDHHSVHDQERENLEGSTEVHEGRSS